MSSERGNDVEVTVVTTLMFPRRQALRALASWTDRQTLGRENIQLVIASNGADRDLERRVSATLRRGDRLVEVETDNEMQLYDIAAREARGRWLMFTEPHVIAHPDCLSSLLCRAREKDLAGVCVRTLPARDTNWVGRLESRMYLEDAENWTREDDWRKFTKRGVLLSQQAYLEAGGLEHRYQRFAEMALAARLRDRGLRLGYAEDAVITHFNSTRLKELTDYIREYQRQACAFDRDFPGVVAGAPRPGDRDEERRMMALQVRGALLALGEALTPVGDREQRRLAATLLAALPRLALERLRSSSRGRAAARLGYLRALAKLFVARLSRDEDRSYDAFLNLWRRAGDLGVADFGGAWTTTAELSPDGARPAGVDDVEVARIPDRFLKGFFPPEVWQEKSLRWTSPVATVGLALPRRATALTLKTLWPDFATTGVRVFLNGRRAAAGPRRASAGAAVFLLSPDDFVEGEAQYLTIVTGCVAAAGREDPRPLGIPLTALHFEAEPGS